MGKRQKAKKKVKPVVLPAKSTFGWTPILVLALSLLFIMILCHPVVFTYCRQKSLEFIIFYRNTYATKSTDKMMTFISGFLGKYGLAAGVVFSHIFLPIFRAQILIVTLAISVFVNTLIKMVVKDSRPFFINDEFFPDKCEFEYGFPSGHSQTAVTFYLTVLTLLFREYNIQRGKYLTYFLVVFWCLTVGMTRVTLGVHTMEQILVGFGFGLIVHVFTCHIYLDQLEAAFKGIETGRTPFFSKIFFMYISFDIIVIFLYNVNTTFLSNPPEWRKNIMTQCSNSQKYVSVDYESLNKQFSTSAKLGCY